jgi:ADP-ribose pyrophosphatase YjhB (NUDIX family)
VSGGIGPQNLRVYGVLLRAGRVLVSAERVAGRDVLKFPGGAVEAGETPETALRREFAEECSIAVSLRALLHAPGTLFSPWTLAPYTPLFYAVDGEGEPTAPAPEPIALSFTAPAEAIASGRMAEPDILALGRAVALARGEA